MAEVKLPEGWLTTKIDEIAEVKGGKRLPKGKALLDTVTEHPYVRVTDFENGSVDISNLKYLDSDTFASIKNYTISKDDLYISIAGTIGLVGEIPDSIDGANLTENAAKICSLTGIQKKYLRYVLNGISAKEQFDDKTTSSGQPKLALFRIKDCTFPLPPKAEQIVIADKLDTLLAKVEITKARLERIPQILKTFRQSVLATAMSGKLTEEWRDQGQSEWPTAKCKLGDLVELAYGKSLPAKTRSGDGYPVYGSNGAVGLHREFLVEAPFIIVGRKGSYGEVTWSGDNGWPIDTTYFVNLRQQSDLKFVYFLLQTLGLNQLNRSTAIPGLNREVAYSQKIVIPKVKEQTEIVRQVEELFAFAVSIEQKTNAALARVNNLTQSILAKAFRGELTADWRSQNLELISGENSAEALLVKIKAEREALKKQPKPKRIAVKKKTGSRMSKQIIKVVDALKEVGKPLSGQQLLAAAGYPSDSSTDQLEQFFLDIREALTSKKSIVKLDRSDDDQDWFALAEADKINKA
jgi:type I restriction enzyme S subunit